jgi:HEAT repeat protein
LEGLRGRGRTLAAAAAEIIAEIQDPQVETIMLRLTGSGNMTVRSIAVETLGGLKKPSLFETLARLINDPSPPVRKSVYDSLVNTDLPRAEHLFRELSSTGKMHDDDRIYLTNLLGEIGRLN